MIEKASETKNSVWATIVGTINILIGATGVFMQFQKSLNTIWTGFPEKSVFWS
jgi:membrane protein